MENEKKSGIYMIRSFIEPEKTYIGSAKNFHSRKLQHLHDLRKNIHKNPKLQAHYNKYGQEDFSFNFVFECDVEVLTNAEQAFLDYYHPWFNINKIADSRKGRPHSIETKMLMSRNRQGRIPWNKGKKMKPISEKHKEAISKASKGRVSPMKGKHHSEETKKRISEANKGQVSWNKGIPTPEDVLEKMRGRTPWNKGLPRELNPQTGKKRKKKNIKE